MTSSSSRSLDAIMGLRVSDEDEMAGLDLSQHSETAYALGGVVLRRVLDGGAAAASPRA